MTGKDIASDIAKLIATTPLIITNKLIGKFIDKVIVIHSHILKV
jgi:hypothetical protein